MPIIDQAAIRVHTLALSFVLMGFADPGGTREARNEAPKPLAWDDPLPMTAPGSPRSSGPGILEIDDAPDGTLGTIIYGDGPSLLDERSLRRPR